MNHDHHGWDHIGFADLWSPGFAALLVGLAIVYLMAVGPYRSRFSESEPVTTGKKMTFILGIFTAYVAWGSPLAYVGHHFLFSAHMLQQSLLLFFVPPLLLLGTPSWLIKPLYSKSWFKKPYLFLTQPFLAVVLFNGLLSFYHFPFIFNYGMEHHQIGNVFHMILFFTSFIMWLNIVSPVPEWDRLSELKKFAYILANGILLYPACAVIIFASQLLYSDSYSMIPPTFSFLSPVDDQQFGGIIMKLMQEGVLILALAIVFFRWFRRENKDDDESTENIQLTNKYV